MVAITWTGFVAHAVDAGVPVRLDRIRLAMLARESASRFLFLCLTPLGWLDFGPSVASGPVGPDKAVPVLLLPGYRMNRSSMWFLRQFLTRRGFRCVWIANPSRSGSLADHAGHLALSVDRLSRLTGAKQVDIVAFSVGGLVAAWFLQNGQGQDRVRRLVTLGTPWLGTRLAVFVRDRIGLEVGFESSALEGLVPLPVPTVSIWSPDDPFVVPTHSALPESIDGVRLEGRGHVDLLCSPAAFRAVKTALEMPAHVHEPLPAPVPEPPPTPESPEPPPPPESPA